MHKLITITSLIILLPALALALSWQERPDPLKPIRTMEITDYDTGTIVTVTIDDSTATYKLEVPEEIVEEKYEGKAETITDPTLYPDFVTASEHAEHQVLPSLELCGQRGKFTDDGAYAAVELQLEAGAGPLEGGKVAFLKRLYQVTAHKEAVSVSPAKDAYHNAMVFITVALLLTSENGTPPSTINIPDDVLEEAGEQMKAFLEEDQLHSKPLGFYTWSKELSHIFSRDRWLMSKLDTSDTEELGLALALCDIITSDTALSAQHTYVITLYSRLTNPPSVMSIDGLIELAGDPAVILADSGALEAFIEKLNPDPDKPPVEFALFPPSRSKEVDLVNKLMGLPAVAGNIMDVLIEYIRKGEISLAPTKDSGWYEYQQYALECLLKVKETPEGEKLKMNEGYIKRLEEAFRTMLTQARETHIKQLDMVIGTVATPEMVLEIDVSPNLLLEPLPTYYLRVARAYTFLLDMLESFLGKDLLGRMHGVREVGEAEMSLAVELVSMQELFYGFYLETCMDIGLEPEATMEIPDPAGAIKRAQNWLLDWKSDPLMGQDIRVIVPMGPTGFGDLNCWCVMGIRPIMVTVSYVDKPTVTVSDPNAVVDINFPTQTYSILVPVFSEVIIPGEVPLTRDEFRAVCDKHQTKEKIISALEKGEGSSINPTKGSSGCFPGGLPGWLYIVIGVVVGILVIIAAVLIWRRRRG